ncbi:hypothetical protein MMC28_000317 [Mycoblastus sanguinarius]|nr:hypothetical protein [Mycoblastus sanguinarius]
MADIEISEGTQPEAPLPSQMTREQQSTVHSVQNGSDHLEIPNIEDDRPKSPTRRRPWSSQGFKSILSPSPSFVESRRSSKDDHDVPVASPVTPKRPNYPPRGLSLQMPPRDISSTSTANLTKRIPVSPKPECPATYPSPSSVLPRRSRGMDGFSRAATNLHHSTLAESSPDSSPTVGTRGGMMIPPRKNLFSPPSSSNMNIPESLGNSLWSTAGFTEKSGLSSSVGSSNMMEYDSGSTSSDADELMENDEDDDTIHMTPHVYSTGIGLMNPFGSVASSPGGDGVGVYGADAMKLMSYQRARRKSRRSNTRKSSSSASGQSSMHSPGPASPPLLRSIESSLSINGGYFLDDPIKKEMISRRESLSLGTNDMQLSDAEQSDDGGSLRRINSHEDVPIPTPVTPGMDERRQVIRRAVTKRSNMLPKSKVFMRTKAALLEEGAPIDTEFRREAEVLRQVRGSDVDADLNLHPSQPNTTASSPNIPAATAGLEHIPEDVSMSGEGSRTRRSSSAFTSQAIRNSGGPTFWNNFDERMRTPPPPVIPRDSSSGISDDVNMDTPISSIQSTTPQQHPVKPSLSPESLSSTVQPPAAVFEVPRKGNKRMRDDDFDPNYFKRRAVSPGLSLQNSPVLPQSPLQRDGSWWGTPKSNREVPSVHVSGERVSSNGSTGSVTGTGGKRVGLQGMTDTHDGLMNMSIE